MNSPLNTVLAVGAAGRHAGLVVPELARRGLRVRAFIRDPKQEAEVRANGAAEIALGDLTDRTSLDRALVGVDRAFYIAPESMSNAAEVGKGFVEAARRAGVRRIVFSGTMHPAISALANHANAAPVEEAILGSGMEYVFLHPAMFFQDLAAGWPKVVETGIYAEPWAADARITWADYRDVAEMAAIALADDRLTDGAYDLCSEGRFDRQDLAALMGAALGRKIEVSTVDRASMANVPAAVLRMFDWYGQHGLSGNPLVLRAILGREPRTIRAYIEELAAGIPRAAAEPTLVAA